MFDLGAPGEIVQAGGFAIDLHAEECNVSLRVPVSEEVYAHTVSDEAAEVEEIARTDEAVAAGQFERVAGATGQVSVAA